MSGSNCKCKDCEPSGRLISKCRPCNPPCDIVDCNDIPLERDCNDNVVLPFRDIVKPGDKNNSEYPHEKDAACRYVICGCPKTQHGDHYPTDEGDPIIGIEGGGAKFDPNTGVWTLNTPVCFEEDPDNCNGITIVEKDGCFYISVIKSEYISKRTEPIVSNDVAALTTANTPENPLVIAEDTLTQVNDACACWWAIEQLAVDARFTDLSNDAYAGIIGEISTDGGATWQFVTNRNVTVGTNGKGSIDLNMEGDGTKVDPGQPLNLKYRLSAWLTQGSASVESFSSILLAKGYTVTG